MSSLDSVGMISPGRGSFCGMSRRDHLFKYAEAARECGAKPLDYAGHGIVVVENPTAFEVLHTCTLCAAHQLVHQDEGDAGARHRPDHARGHAEQHPASAGEAPAPGAP